MDSTWICVLLVSILYVRINHGLDLSGSGTPPLWPGTTSAIEGQDIEVQTTTGTVIGKRREWTSQAGGISEEVDWFLGIPYAKPPNGTRRFKAPERIASWPRVIRAVRFGAVCPQKDVYQNDLPTSEDCLTLNIFSPAKTGHTWPVMVYLHGGFYKEGTGATHLGHLLSQRGVIVVTINYRLGPLGFLAARDQSSLPGNYGLLDQIEALRWVQNNIGSFSGDPQKVTLFGKDAGSASVGILTLSPLAKGLFQQAILQSGSPLADWAIHNDTVDLDEHVRQFAKLFNCTMSSIYHIEQCLQAVPEKFFSNTDIINKYPAHSPSGIDFRPTVDHHVIMKQFSDWMKESRVHDDVSRVMMGVVDEEWSALHVSYIIDLLPFGTSMNQGVERTSFRRCIQHIFQEKLGWDQSIHDSILHHYTSHGREYDLIANRDMYIKMMCDFTVAGPMEELAKYFSSDNGVRVYAYEFKHRSAATDRPWRSKRVDVNYVFGGPYIDFSMAYGQGKQYSSLSNDTEISNVIMTIWTDFAKYGEPSKTADPPIKWDTFNENSDRKYLNINTTSPNMATFFKSQAAVFWNDVIASLRTKLHTPPEAWYITHQWVLITVAVAVGVIILVGLICGCCCLRKGRNQGNFQP